MTDLAPGSDDGAQQDIAPADAGPDAGGDDGGEAPRVRLPDPPALAGVAYVGHFLSPDLRVLRIDGAEPRLEATVTTGGLNHDMVVDHAGDMLWIVHDDTRSVEGFALSRPSGPGAPVTPPRLVSSFSFPAAHVPRFALLDPHGSRLYVVVPPPPPADGGPTLEYALHAYDVSAPEAPAELAASPFIVPATSSYGLDPVRKVFFVFSARDVTLTLYDIDDDGVRPFGGPPIELTKHFVGDNNTAFTMRNMVVDAARQRLYAARSQTALSELMAFELVADLPRVGQPFSELMDHQDLAIVEDFFAVERPLDDRPHLLDAYTPLPDPTSGEVFFVADAWNGRASSAQIWRLGADLDAKTACGEYEGFACWLRASAAAGAGTHFRTDGAACIDWERRVLVATSLSTGEPDGPGRVHTFRWDDDGGMSPWLPAGGGALVVDELPVSAVCH